MEFYTQGDPAEERRAGQRALAEGRFQDAQTYFAQSLQNEPNNPSALCGLSAAQFGLGDHISAFDSAKRACAAAPQQVEPVMVLGAPALYIGDRTASKFCFDVVKQVDKRVGRQLIDFWIQRLIERDRFHEAAAAFTAYITAHAPDYDTLAQYAEMLLNAFLPEKAIEPINHLRDLRPNEGGPFALLARYHLQLGDLKAASENALKAVELDPDCIVAYTVLAEVDPHALTAELQERLSARMGAPETPLNVRILAGSALGRALDAQGATDAAFGAISEASKLAKQAARASGRTYGRSQGEDSLAQAAMRFPPDAFHTPPANPERGRGLIFIVGLPRSGSTLVDQILSSHSQVISAGECVSLSRVYEAILARQLQTGAEFLTIVDQFADEWEELYRRGLRLAGASSPFIVDKSLQNFWSLGLIARLFPAAKIIEMHRNPMDTGLSIYKLFYLGTQSYANDLEDIAHYTKCYEQMTVYWRRVLPKAPLRLDYDAFIDDFEAGVRDLLSYCGLEMEEACLEFHKSERPVFTLSAAQVREGVSKAGKGRWRGYETHLEPLQRALETITVRPPVNDV